MSQRKIPLRDRLSNPQKLVILSGLALVMTALAFVAVQIAPPEPSAATVTSDLLTAKRIGFGLLGFIAALIFGVTFFNDDGGFPITSFYLMVVGATGFAYFKGVATVFGVTTGTFLAGIVVVPTLLALSLTAVSRLSGDRQPVSEYTGSNNWPLK